MTLPIIGHYYKIMEMASQQNYIAKSHSDSPVQTKTIGHAQSLYRQLSNLMHRLLKDITNRKAITQHIDLRQKNRTYEGLAVSGIADRLPREQDHGHEQPNRDLILLGQCNDYSSLVKSITFSGETYSVSDENGQLIARYLNFGNERSVSGYLTLANGSTIPLHISVIIAL